MRFWEAMKIVDEGGKVRRDIWAEALYVYKDNLSGLMLAGLEDAPVVYEILIDDPLKDDWEVDSESFVIEALPRTVVYTLQDGDIDPDTGDVYLEEDDE
jgi:hypothetical protein